MPQHVRTPKHLRVSIDQSCVKVIDQSNQVVILDGTLARKWKASEAMWSVVAGKKLQITVGMFSNFDYNLLSVLTKTLFTIST